MTDELQTEESGATLNTDPIKANEAKADTAESGAELATATDGQQDKANDGAQKAINKQHAKFREEERLKVAAQNDAKELREKLDAIEANKADVTIPPIPDPYDDDFEEKVKARDKAITHRATQDAQKQVAIDQQSASAEAAKKAENERFQLLIDDYDKRIVTLGLDKTEVRAAGDKVMGYGIPFELVEHIADMDDGPLITTYLAENPILVDDLRHMTSMQAAVKINSDIKLAASAMKPQASSAPDPAETLSGRGAGEKQSAFLDGATFE